MALCKFIASLVFCYYFVFCDGRYIDDTVNEYDNDGTVSSFFGTSELPFCYPPCQNNGICVENFVCKCPQNIKGEYCEDYPYYESTGYEYYEISTEPTTDYAYYETSTPPTTGYEYYETSTPSTTDYAYYETSTPPTTDYAYYETSTPPTTGYEYYETSTPSTTDYPFYDAPTPPTTKKFKIQCSYNLLPPISKNAIFMGFIISHGSPIGFKVQCISGYYFPDGSQLQYLDCFNGKWYHKESLKSEVPDCQKIQTQTQTCKDLANVKSSCQCTYNGLTFNTNYKQICPGDEFLELCTCEGGIWNCSLASKEDKHKYPSSFDLNVRCANNPDSCRIKSSIECSEKPENTISAKGFISKLLEYALGLKSEQKWQLNTKKSEALNSSQGNAAEHSIKVMSLNLQSIEINGGE